MDPEEVKGVEDAVSKALAEKLPEILKTVEEASVQNAQKAAVATPQDVDKSKSVMRSIEKHGKLAAKAPFITLGADMEAFTKSFIERTRGIVKAADQNITDLDDGGYLVAPAELDQAILQYQFQESIVRPYATIRTVRGNTFKINNLDQSENSYGGVTMTWNTEGGEIENSSLKFGQQEITLGKLTGLNVISNELLQDSLVNVANYIVQVFGAAVTYYEDLAFINGAVSNNSPLGILKTPGILTVNRAEANKISYVDINAMYHAPRTSVRKSCVWIGSSTAIAHLDGQVDEFGRPLLSSSMHETMQMRLKGAPVIELDEAYLPALGSKGDLIFVDLSKYYIVDKVGLRVDASIHDRFRYDEVSTRFVKRVTGKLMAPYAAVALDVPAVY